MTGTLYIVSTPIGNLEDITLRAIRILKEVEVILCEDTRETYKLLKHYDIKTKTESYHANSKLTKIESICRRLEEGKDIALVSDAGTPILSDPGILLVQEIYKNIDDARVIPIPGASALLSAIVASGINSHQFTFLGFVPHKKGRETLFKTIEESMYTVVVYESVHRILKTLESLVKYLGTNRTVAVHREMTKHYEERIAGSAKDVLEYYKGNPDKLKGEFVIVISPKE
jgi:16S rRNA (cytidine1402-2'-O)-methyltransferase